MDASQLNQLADLLAKLDPGYLPEPIFLEFTRLSVTGILEMVPLRKNSLGEIQVLVKKRPADDAHWPGMLHTPGTVLRPTDDDGYQSALARVFAEVYREHSSYRIKNVGTAFHMVNRGKELAVIFAVMIDGAKEEDIWLGLDEIKEKIVDTQVEFVNQAVKAMNL